MMVIWLQSWTWKPAVFDAAHPQAPYRKMLLWGCWLVLWGRREGSRE